MRRVTITGLMPMMRFAGFMVFCIAMAGCGNNAATTNTPALEDTAANAGMKDADTAGTTDDCSQMETFPIPTAAKPTDIHMEALAGGELKLVEGCLRVGDHILVWPYGYTAYKCNDTVFIHNDKNKRVFRTGDILRVGGGEAGELSVMNGEYANIPDRTCKGRGWIVGEIRKAD